MKDLYHFSFLIFITVALCCCEQQEKSHTAKYVLDIHDPADIHINDFIYDIDTIRLEVTEESLMNDIRSMHIMDEKIYILTYKMNTIYIYDIKGNYISKIDDHGNGPNEYTSICSFDIDPIRKRIILADHSSRKIFIYNKEGIQTDVISLNFAPCLIAPYKNGFVNIYSGPRLWYTMDNMENYEVHFLDERGQLISSAIEKSVPGNINLDSPFQIDCLNDGSLLFHPTLGDIIYKIDDNGVCAYYEFNNFSKYKMMTAEEKKSFEYVVEKDKNTVKEKEDYGYLMTWGTVLDLDDLVFFAFGGWSKRLFLYYDKKTTKTIFIDPKTMKGDPVLINYLLFYPRNTDGKKFYVSITPSSQIIEHIVNNTSNKKVKTFFEKTDPESNPLLISFKIKIPNQ